MLTLKNFNKVSSLMSYEEVIAMRGNTSQQHEATATALNENGTAYFEKFNDEGKLSQDFETYILIGSYQYPYELRCEYRSARGQYRRYVGDNS